MKNFRLENPSLLLVYISVKNSRQTTGFRPLRHNLSPTFVTFYLLGARGPNSLSQTSLLPNFLPDYLSKFAFTSFYSSLILFYSAKEGQTLLPKRMGGHSRISPLDPPLPGRHRHALSGNDVRHRKLPYGSLA